MGLDITAYSHLKHVGKHTDGWCEDNDHVQAFAYDCFPASFRGIPVLGTEQHSGTGLMVGGCHEFTAETERHGFRAGSYGGYNAWRSDLQAKFNPELHSDSPFYELIFFADNEGCIGPDAARDLLADFEQHAAEYGASRPGGPLSREYELQRYADWTRAFRLAADGGLVRFH
ncbi:hypothetical protein ACH4T9_31345 [Micromonospora sp. NPDC020750]|uniref:hypothetical protein n=1 Tax=unclassified Micromonospora TaxID=2617518 RepID=UPI0037A234DC